MTPDTPRCACCGKVTRPPNAEGGTHTSPCIRLTRDNEPLCSICGTAYTLGVQEGQLKTPDAPLLACSCCGRLLDPKETGVVIENHMLRRTIANDPLCRVCGKAYTRGLDDGKWVAADELVSHLQSRYMSGPHTREGEQQ